jgi:hypothetical protein
MASGVYNVFKNGVMGGSYTLDGTVASTKPVFCALLNNSYTFDPDHKFFGQFSGTYEIVGTAYVAGGAALSSPTLTQDDTNDLGKFDANDVLWGVSSITARYAVLYSSNGAAGKSYPLIACFDFGSDQVSSAGSFTIVWNGSGILFTT